MRRQVADRRLFVLSHQAAISIDIGTQNSGKRALHTYLLQARFAQIGVAAFHRGDILTHLLRRYQSELGVEPHDFRRFGAGVLIAAKLRVGAIARPTWL
jgi:hypothetical protein